MILNKILMYDADRLHYIITRFLNRDHVLGSLKNIKVSLRNSVQYNKQELIFLHFIKAEKNLCLFMYVDIMQINNLIWENISCIGVQI